MTATMLSMSIVAIGQLGQVYTYDNLGQEEGAALC
jgi:hypothetical protein